MELQPSAPAGSGSRKAPGGAAPSLYGLPRARLAHLLEERGLPGYRAGQLYSWLYRKHALSPEGMTDLPRDLRGRLAEDFDLSLPSIVSVHRSGDGGTHKFVLELEAGAGVECVSMQTERRLTFCISSQAGCALRCAFCATGVMGLKRNLSPAEIVGQVLRMGEHAAWRDPSFNLVFMGMGEPLANYAAVLAAIRILHDPSGLSVGARRITLSTCGLAPQMERLGQEGLPLGLALSLHATTDELRDRLVPVNKRYPLRELIPAARHYGEASGRRVTLEYILLAGVNDRREDAVRLARLARELPSKVNLIPYNPVPGLPWRRPTPEAVQTFAEWLYPQAPAVTVRRTQGAEIWAACGQLGGLSPRA